MKIFFRKMRHRSIIGNIDLPPNSNVLDTSCQDGTFLEVLLEKNKDKNLKISGIDINSKEVSKARELIKEGSFVVSDNKILPFADKTFDIVITSMTLHHMANPVESISEMKRVLKDDGTIYLIDFIVSNKFLYKIFNFIKCPEPYHFEKFYSFAEVQDLSSEIGLKIQKVDSKFAFPTFSIFSIVSVLKLRKY